MNEEELKEALAKAGRIIDHWERQELDSQEAMEMLAPLLATITAHIERVDPAAESSSDPNLEKAESEELQEDLFSKEESGDLEEEKEDVIDDESKSKSKKRKKFAGSNGEIPF